MGGERFVERINEATGEAPITCDECGRAMLVTLMRRLR